MRRTPVGLGAADWAAESSGSSVSNFPGVRSGLGVAFTFEMPSSVPATVVARRADSGKSEPGVEHAERVKMRAAMLKTKVDLDIGFHLLYHRELYTRS